MLGCIRHLIFGNKAEITHVFRLLRPSQLRTSLKVSMLWELAKGMVLTGRYTFARKVTVHYLRKRKRLSLQGFVAYMPCVVMTTVRSGVLLANFCEAVCPAMAITIEAGVRQDGTRRTTRYDIDLTKCILRFL